jgi:fructokinase
VLWDCLPAGRFLGGATLNVAYHAARLGARAAVLSCVGRDEPGDAALTRLAASGIDVSHVARHARLPTGLVAVEVGAGGQPSYTIAEPAAWDEIPLSTDALAAAEHARVIVYGTLAARSAANRGVLDRLLTVTGPWKVLDVNLRPPFDDLERALGLARRADIVKVNDAELARVSGVAVDAAAGFPALRPAIAALAARIGPRTICVTCGERGAALWRDGELCSAPAPRVTVADTVGAGDAFTAALVLSLLADGSPAGIRAALARACGLGALVASLPGAQPEYDPEPFRAAAAGRGRGPE